MTVPQRPGPIHRGSHQNLQVWLGVTEDGDLGRHLMKQSLDGRLKGANIDGLKQKWRDGLKDAHVWLRPHGGEGLLEPTQSRTIDDLAVRHHLTWGNVHWCHVATNIGVPNHRVNTCDRHRETSWPSSRNERNKNNHVRNSTWFWSSTLNRVSKWLNLLRHLNLNWTYYVTGQFDEGRTLYKLLWLELHLSQKIWVDWKFNLSLLETITLIATGHAVLKTRIDLFNLQCFYLSTLLWPTCRSIRTLITYNLNLSKSLNCNSIRKLMSFDV